jgi:hypothetical protein
MPQTASHDPVHDRSGNVRVSSGTAAGEDRTSENEKAAYYWNDRNSIPRLREIILENLNDKKNSAISRRISAMMTNLSGLVLHRGRSE